MHEQKKVISDSVLHRKPMKFTHQSIPVTWSPVVVYMRYDYLFLSHRAFLAWTLSDLMTLAFELLIVK